MYLSEICIRTLYNILNMNINREREIYDRIIKTLYDESIIIKLYELVREESKKRAPLPLSKNQVFSVLV